MAWKMEFADSVNALYNSSDEIIGYECLHCKKMKSPTSSVGTDGLCRTCLNVLPLELVFNYQKSVGKYHANQEKRNTILKQVNEGDKP